MGRFVVCVDTQCRNYVAERSREPWTMKLNRALVFSSFEVAEAVAHWVTVQECWDVEHLTKDEVDVRFKASVFVLDLDADEGEGE